MSGLKGRHTVLAAAVVVSLAVLSGCASTPTKTDWLQQLADRLRARGLDPVEIVEPLRLTDEMREFAVAAVAGVKEEEKRVVALVNRLIDPKALDLTYAWGYTGTAVEVFERGEANCLAFTNLFVSLARSVNLPVHYLLVRDSESFRKEGDLVVISDHVAVGYGSGPHRTVIDLSRDASADGRRVVPISDLTALALYFSNRGAETLQEGSPESALPWLEKAIRLDPEQSSTWVNYGVALRRADRFADAEVAYRQALELDPGSGSASNNLASLMRLEGRLDEARELEEVLAKGSGRNPYTYLALGDISLRGGRVDEAERLYRRAIYLDRAAAEGYAALGQLAVVVGDRDAARKLLRKAQKRDAEHPRARLLARALDGGGGP